MIMDTVFKSPSPSLRLKKAVNEGPELGTPLFTLSPAYDSMVSSCLGRVKAPQTHLLRGDMPRILRNILPKSRTPLLHQEVLPFHPSPQIYLEQVLK